MFFILFFKKLFGSDYRGAIGGSDFIFQNGGDSEILFGCPEKGLLWAENLYSGVFGGEESENDLSFLWTMLRV